MTNILITDAGGAAAVGVLKSLKNRDDVKKIGRASCRERV